MTHEITSLRNAHKELRNQEREWLTECRNLNIAIRESGPLIGLDLTAEAVGDIVEKQHEVARLRCDLDDIRERIADVEVKLNEMEADEAERLFLEAIDALEEQHTSAMEMQLLNSGMRLIQAKRIGQSAVTLRLKIQRSLNPSHVRGVKVTDKLDDLRHYVKRKVA